MTTHWTFSRLLQPSINTIRMEIMLTLKLTNLLSNFYVLQADTALI